MEGKNSTQYTEKSENGEISLKSEEENDTFLLLRHIEINNKIHRDVVAMEAMMVDHHPNRRKTAANLRILAEMLEVGQSSTTLAKVTGATIGILGGVVSIAGGAILISAADGITAPMMLAVGTTFGFIGSATSVASSVANNTMKLQLVREIAVQVREEREFYEQVEKELTEINLLMAENETVFQKLSKNATAAAMWAKTTLFASKGKELWSKMNMDKINQFTFDDPNNCGQRKFGSVAIGVGLAAFSFNLYNLVDGFEGFSRTEAVKKIRELADLLVQFDNAQNEDDNADPGQDQ